MKLSNTTHRKSWDHTLMASPLYKSKTTGKVSLDMAYILDQEPELTINPAFVEQNHESTFFNEIGLVDYPVQEKWKPLTKAMPKFSDDLLPKDIAGLMIRAIEGYFLQVWDNTVPTLVFCSMGMDSRIISWVLASIREKQGADFLGDIHFRAHGAESLHGFKEMMKKQGWKKDQYSIYKPDQMEKPGYHNMGDPDNVCNGYLRPTINFWDDLIKSGNEKN